jgi:hypothetical protein
MLKRYQVLVLASPLSGHLIDQELGVRAELNTIDVGCEVEQRVQAVYSQQQTPVLSNVVAADQRLVQAGNVFVLLIECDEGTGRWARLGG